MNKAILKKSKKISEFLPEDKELKILDLGCADGKITNYLFELGYKNIEGFDLNQNSIKQAKKNYPQINFWVANAFDVDYSKYDLIYAWGVLYYIRDIDKLLKKIRKEMKKGSLLVFSTPNICSLNKRVKCLFGISPLIGKEFHPKAPLTFKGAEQLITPLDFKNTDIIPYHYDGKLNFMPIKNLSSHIIVKLRK